MIWASAMANVAPMQTGDPRRNGKNALLDAELWRRTARSLPKLHGIYTIRDIYGLNRLISLYFYEIVNPSALSNEFVMLPEGAAAPRATQLASRTLSSSGGSYRFAWNSM
jgi:hypothetical protein